LVLAEAQASGVPVVYYDDIHNPSGIVADGLSGFIAPQGDVKKFADLIVKALDYSWDYDAIQKSADYLSQDNVSKKYLDFIKHF
jgi:glycosyltransferase involved in cell wall biosynthesis